MNPKRLTLAAAASTLLLGCSDHTLVGISGTLRDDAGSRDATLERDVQLMQLGLEGRYFPTLDLSGEPSLIRVDPLLNALWEGPDGPTPEIPNIFSVRWSGWLVPATTEVHTIRVDCDDGSRVWIDDQLIVDIWEGGGNSAEGTVNLFVDRPHKIVVEFFSFGGNASIKLSWSSATIPLQVIPADRFVLKL